ALECEAARTRETVIVGLLELGLARPGTVMLVRRIARPVSTRGDDFDHLQALGRGGRRQYVAHVAGVGADTSHLFPDLFRPDQPWRQIALPGCRAHGKLAVRSRRDAHRRARRHVDRKGFPFEGTASQSDGAKVPPLDRDGGATGEQHETLLAAFDASLERAARSEVEYFEPNVAPTRVLGCDPVHLRGRRGEIGLYEQRAAHRRFSATSWRRLRNPRVA